MMQITCGYMRLLQKATVYLHNSGNEALLRLYSGSIVYASQRPDTGLSADRLKVSFDTDAGVQVGYIDANPLYPLTNSETETLVAELSSHADCVFFGGNRNLPLPLLAYEAIPAGTEAPDQEPTPSPTVTLTVTPTASASENPADNPTTGKLPQGKAQAKSTVINVNNINDLQSGHHYTENVDIIWVYTVPNASWITLTFSPETDVLVHVDLIEIYDENRIYYECFSGTALANKTITIPDSRVYVRLTSFYEYTGYSGYGFSITSGGGYVSPTLLSCTPTSSTAINLNWNASSLPDGYTIYRATTSPSGATTAFKRLCTVAGSASTYLDKSAVAGNINLYKLIAYKTRKLLTYQSTPSNVLKAYPIGTPVISSANRLSASSIKLQWGKVTGATGYALYSSPTLNGTYTYLRTVNGSTNYTFTGLYCRPYYFKVRSAIKIS